MKINRFKWFLSFDSPGGLSNGISRLNRRLNNSFNSCNGSSLNINLGRLRTGY